MVDIPYNKVPISVSESDPLSESNVIAVLYTRK